VRVWQTKEWKDRRDALIGRTTICEWCKDPFDKKNPAAVHHLRERAGFDKYMELASDEIVVICKKCHFIWTKYRIRRGDPLHTCKKCGGVKVSRRFDLCFRCAGAEGQIELKPTVGPPESFFEEL
jgi:hypothetical protein